MLAVMGNSDLDDEDRPLVALRSAAAPEPRLPAPKPEQDDSSNDSSSSEDDDEGSTASSSGSQTGSSSEEDSSEESEEEAGDAQGAGAGDAMQSATAGKRKRKAPRSPSSYSSGSGSDGTGGSKPRRKRRNVFRRISSSERCGKCHTCLNPRLKKACETVRAQQLKEAGKLGLDGLPVKRSKSSSKKHRERSSANGGSSHDGGHTRSAGPAAPPAPAPATSNRGGPASPGPGSDSYLRTALARMLGPRGGISGTHHMPEFESLLQSQTGLGPRSVLLTVLNMSSQDIKAALVKGRGIQILESWVVEAVDGAGEIRDPAARGTLIAETVGLLKALPVDVEALRRTGIGRTFAKLSKALSKGGNGDLPANVSLVCKDLVDQWKRVAEKAEASKAAAASGAAASEGVLPASGDSGGTSVVSAQGQGGPAHTPSPALHRQGSLTSQPSPASAASGQPPQSSSVPLGAEPPTQPTVEASLQPSVSTSQPGHQQTMLHAGADPALTPGGLQAQVHAAGTEPSRLPSSQDPHGQEVPSTSQPATAYVSTPMQPSQAAQVSQLVSPESGRQLGADTQMADASPSSNEAAKSPPPVDDAPAATGEAAVAAALPAPEAAPVVSTGPATAPTGTPAGAAPARPAAITASSAAERPAGATSTAALTTTTLPQAGSNGAPSHPPLPHGFLSRPGARGAGLQLSVGRLAGVSAVGLPSPGSAGGSGPTSSVIGPAGGQGATRLGSVRDGSSVIRLGSLSGGTGLGGLGGVSSTGGSTTSQILQSEARAASMFGGAGLGEGFSEGLGHSSGSSVSLAPKVLSAAERAALAAARSETPPLGPGEGEVARKKSTGKRKRVTWPSDEEKIVSVRWFRKEDAPIAAAKDVPVGDANEVAARGPAAAAGPIPLPSAEQQSASNSLAGLGHLPSAFSAGGMMGAAFQTAARREHEIERAALAAQHEVEVKERAAMLERLALMTASSEWPPEGPPAIPIDPSVVAGEESVEVHEQAARALRLPAANYPSPHHVPPSPAEPAHPEPPITPDAAAARIPRIPLTTPGAAAQGKTPAAHTAPPLPQQPSQHVHHPTTGHHHTTHHQHPHGHQHQPHGAPVSLPSTTPLVPGVHPPHQQHTHGAGPGIQPQPGGLPQGVSLAGLLSRPDVAAMMGPQAGNPGAPGPQHQQPGSLPPQQSQQQQGPAGGAVAAALAAALQQVGGQQQGTGLQPPPPGAGGPNQGPSLSGLSALLANLAPALRQGGGQPPGSSTGSAPPPPTQAAPAFPPGPSFSQPGLQQPAAYPGGPAGGPSRPLLFPGAGGGGGGGPHPHPGDRITGFASNPPPLHAPVPLPPGPSNGPHARHSGGPGRGFHEGPPPPPQHGAPPGPFAPGPLQSLGAPGPHPNGVLQDRRDVPPVPAAGAPVPGGPPRNPNTKLCAFFNTPQGCRRGESCQFLHVAGVNVEFPTRSGGGGRGGGGPPGAGPAGGGGGGGRGGGGGDRAGRGRDKGDREGGWDRERRDR